MTTMPWVIREFDEIDSTNTWLVAQARNGAAAGLVARADFQTAGRGRLDRTWEAPRGAGLLMSVLLEPPVGLEDLQIVTAAVALAARSALIRLCGLAPQLKWPNDLIVNGAKLGGVLAELVDDTPRVVVGIGVNLTWPGPPGVGGTCVKDLTGITLSPRSVLDLMLAELEMRLNALASSEGHDEVLGEYHHALDTVGRDVRVEQPTGELVGRALGVQRDGSLIVESDGAEHVVRVGDVIHVRAAQ